MQRSARRFTMSIFVPVLVAVSATRASEIDFSWQSSFNPGTITPDQPGSAAIILSPISGNAKYQVGSGGAQYAVGLAAQSPPLLQIPVTYSDRPFAMTLKLTDGPSGLSDALTFHGTVNGTVFIGTHDLAGSVAPFSFSDGARSVTIGQDTYHINMQGGVIWPGPDTISNIFAKIDVTPTSTTPEPSSLLLAGMALPALWFTRRRTMDGVENRCGKKT